VGRDRPATPTTASNGVTGVAEGSQIRLPTPSTGPRSPVPPGPGGRRAAPARAGVMTVCRSGGVSRPPTSSPRASCDPNGTRWPLARSSSLRMVRVRTLSQCPAAVGHLLDEDHGAGPVPGAARPAPPTAPISPGGVGDSRAIASVAEATDPLDGRRRREHQATRPATSGDHARLGRRRRGHQARLGRRRWGPRATRPAVALTRRDLGGGVG
jgi:hypothetical protein